MGSGVAFGITEKGIGDDAGDVVGEVEGIRDDLFSSTRLIDLLVEEQTKNKKDA